MAKPLNYHALLVSIPLAIVATACGNTSTSQPEMEERTEWNVTINKVVEFNDSVLDIETDYKYTVADTSRVNAVLKDLPRSENTTISWTIPHADGFTQLVAYDNEPLLSETVTVTEVSPIPAYDKDILVSFKFPDADKWEAITRENIGQTLAVIVNGQLISTPKLNMAIPSGMGSVSIPAEKIHEYLPDLDLEKLKY